MDFVTKLLLLSNSLTNTSYNNILVITDKLTKYKKFILYKKESMAKQLVYIFFRKVISQYKLLKEIINNKNIKFIF